MKPSITHDLTTMEGCLYFIEMNMPLTVRMKRGNKWMSPFRSRNAHRIVCKALGESLFNELNSSKNKINT